MRLDLSIRKYGYSLRGTPAQVFQLLVGGKRTSAIPILTCDIEDVYTSTETMNGRSLWQCLLPIIMSFDGVNPCSVMVMDNASIHDLVHVQDITGVGARSTHSYHYIALILCPPQRKYSRK